VGSPTVRRDYGYGPDGALARAVEAVEAQYVSSSIVISGLA
jgi:hypothetical protein